MSSKDSEIKSAIVGILQNSHTVGSELKFYFDNIPEKDLRRAIHILSSNYPDKIVISDDEFAFIVYLFSNIKFIVQENFFEFVSAINIVEFNETQSTLLIAIIKEQLEILCEKCTFELDTLLVKLFKPCELMAYISTLLRDSNNIAVLQHCNTILMSDDFFNDFVADEIRVTLKQQIAYKIGKLS